MLNFFAFWRSFSRSYRSYSVICIQSWAILFFFFPAVTEIARSTHTEPDQCHLFPFQSGTLVSQHGSALYHILPG